MRGRAADGRHGASGAGDEGSDYIGERSRPAVERESIRVIGKVIREGEEKAGQQKTPQGSFKKRARTQEVTIHSDLYLSPQSLSSQWRFSFGG